MKYLLIFLVVAALIALAPLLTIWALNTLFPALDIPYDLRTWAATIVICAVINPTYRVKD